MHIVDSHGTSRRTRAEQPAPWPMSLANLPATLLTGTAASMARSMIARAYIAAIGQPSPTLGFLLAMTVELCGALMRLREIQTGFVWVSRIAVMITAAAVFLIADGERNLAAERAGRQATPHYWRQACRLPLAEPGARRIPTLEAAALFGNVGNALR